MNKNTFEALQDSITALFIFCLVILLFVKSFTMGTL
jgi:hypothetical protein